MYVTGTVSATDKVTIDIGTGYFVEVGLLLNLQNFQGGCPAMCCRCRALKQVDVASAFLNGDLDKEMWAALPPGFGMTESAACHAPR
eukprot:351281-Chlamydomonas_euryale.AAC.8